MQQPRERRATVSRRKMLTSGSMVGVGALSAGLTGCNSADSGSDADSQIKEKVENPSDNIKKTGFPIVKKPTTIQFMTGRYVLNAKDYNNVSSWKKYEKMTNVHIDWGLVPFDDRSEKRNLALSGGDYPEAFNTMALSVRDLGKYGDQGIFVKVNELIDKYMPNLKKLLDNNKEFRGGVTFPDDGIYSFPRLADPEFTAMRIEQKLWCRGDWLDKFDMDVPKTVEDLYRYLRAVKKNQPNGKGNSIGYCDRSSGSKLRDGLMGAFGVRNRGTSQGYIDADPKDHDKVRFFPIDDGYRALIEHLHKLYSEGLIAKNIYSVDQSKVKSLGAKGVYGSVGEISPTGFIGGKAKNFVPMPALKGPEGDHSWNLVGSRLITSGTFVMTDKNKHPVETARWMDYFYSDDGTKLFHMGVEGKSYKETKNGPEYLDKITNNPKGMTQDEALSPYVTYMGGGYSGIIKEGYFKGVETADDAVKAAELLKPDTLEEVWPAFTFTQDESERLDSVADDIEKYVTESRDKFITGKKPLSDWKKYVEKIKQMGLDEYMEIQQAAYDRYRKL